MNISSQQAFFNWKNQMIFFIIQDLLAYIYIYIYIYMCVKEKHQSLQQYIVIRLTLTLGLKSVYN
uniref:Transmembrane protein n=1 Tax=Octopus bimaculoides TaxID=37653 RepID=A0A0L8HHA1_OCTBM